MFYLFIFILGLIIGSFLNVVILRLRNGENIAGSRSHCPHCKHQLNALDLIPVLSFVAYRGKCRYCHDRISWQYPIVELVTGIVFLAVFVVNQRYGVSSNFQFSIFNFQTWFPVIRDWIFSCFLIVIFVYDLRWYLILDKVTIPAMIFAVVANLYLGLGWQNLLLAAIIGLGFFLVQFLVSRGAWIGGGDLRMGFLMGLMLGWPNIITGLILSYIIGAVISVILVSVKKKSFKSQIPFGTFLAIGTFIALLWGNRIISWYLGLM